MQIPDAALHNHQTAMWLCTPCGRGFWHCETSEEARAAYRPEHHDWGFDSVWLHVAREREVREAHIRRSSLRPDHLPLIASDSLLLLSARLDLHPEFAEQVEKHLNQRKPNPKA